MQKFAKPVRKKCWRSVFLFSKTISVFFCVCKSTVFCKSNQMIFSYKSSQFPSSDSFYLADDHFLSSQKFVGRTLFIVIVLENCPGEVAVLHGTPLLDTLSQGQIALKILIVIIFHNIVTHLNYIHRLLGIGPSIVLAHFNINPLATTLCLFRDHGPKVFIGSELTNFLLREWKREIIIRHLLQYYVNIEILVF